MLMYGREGILFIDFKYSHHMKNAYHILLNESYHEIISHILLEMWK